LVTRSTPHPRRIAIGLRRQRFVADEINPVRPNVPYTGRMP